LKTGSTIQTETVALQELWRKFQIGDEKALSEIYSLFFSHLYNYGFKFSADASLVEDCIQDLFIKLIRNRETLSAPDSVKNYLFKAFRSHIFDKLEKLKKYPVQQLGETFEFGLEPHWESEIIREEDRETQMELMRTLLKTLTPRQREAIFLKYEEGFSYPEIAEMLSLTTKAAYKLVGRAIHTLRSATQSNFDPGTLPQKKK
jgi:RNA polymerase sigma factor (sigma-70 family)